MGTSQSYTSDCNAFIHEKIHAKKVVMFVKPYCPYCKTAIGLFRGFIGTSISENDMDVVDISNNPRCSEIQDALRKMTGARTVPRIFINGKSLGGCDDAQRAQKTGKLYELLKS
uniref:Glutaredoxin-1 n=2 Tax=Schistocephalus solidus TaxID=70667 RepID=A0A0X3P7Q6_SCHSO